ncbi:MAG: hypothetical protein QM831_13100 [Kofleriaceae bacterium]
MKTKAPTKFVMSGKLVRCPHCEGELFFATKSSFHTAGQSLLNVEWLAKEVHVLVCADCTRLESFYDEPESVLTP